MKILITGAGGFIGKHLSAYLRKKHDVFIVGSVGAKSRASLGGKSIKVDLTNAEEVAAVFGKFSKTHMVDVVIHLAFNLASPKDVDNVGTLHKNIQITENVASIVKILMPKKVINFSSMAVYPNNDGIYKESSEVKPSENNDCLYGLSKLCAENIIDFVLRGQDVSITHLRIAQVYGDGMRQDRIIPAMLRELEMDNAITVFGDGERTSNFIKIDKLVRMVEVFIRKDVSGTYNIGDENISYRELARRLIREHGDKRSRIIQKSEGPRTKFRLDISKLNGMLKEKS